MVLYQNVSESIKVVFNVKPIKTYTFTGGIQTAVNFIQEDW